MSATPKMRGQNDHKNRKEITNEKLLKFMKEECRPVKGLFKNYECAGATGSITQCKYPFHAELNRNPIFKATMTDGEEYEVPLWVARWLNGTDVTAEKCNGKIGSCGYPKHAYSMEKDGVTAVPIVGKQVQRYGFKSLEFAV